MDEVEVILKAQLTSLSDKRKQVNLFLFLSSKNDLDIQNIFYYKIHLFPILNLREIFI